MSHLSTIINRVNRRNEMYGADTKYPEESVYSDFLFEQSVINLIEYIEDGSDFTIDEAQEAINLYDQHRKFLRGANAPSHKERIEHADKVRNRIFYPLGACGGDGKQ